MKKTLYFESAGCAEYNGINCRIRTAFTNNDDKKIYIEFLCGHIPNKKTKTEYHFLHCDYCHYITEDPEIDDCNNSRLTCEGKDTREIEYTKENILAFVNENCNASFDKIVVLNNLAGFRVHSNSGRHNTSERYNFGDTFEYDEELTKKRILKVAELSKHFKQIFNQRYDNTSYYINNNNQLEVCINVGEKERIKAGYTNRKFIVEV